MICKKDVVLWFKELESYKRIDTMCTLLNMCLPFELRFLGTCLEELGRRDSQELRGIELRVNNAGDLAADMVACQKGEPTDKKIRRKMALYLALIRACNKTCVTEIFRTLDGWGDRDFQSMTDVDTLQELLLVYTMAAHHPVFSFDQHTKCNEIFERIKENKLVKDDDNNRQQQYSANSTTTPLSFNEQTGTMGVGVLPNSQNLDSLQQQQQPSTVYPHLIAAPIQMLPQGTMPMNFPHLTKLLPSADGSIQHQLALDGIPHMITSNISIPTDMLAHPNGTWSLRPYPPPSTQLPPASGGSSSSNISISMEPPPQTSSPMLSQQSSPASSRAASPNRLQHQQPQTQQQHQQHQQIRNMSQRIPSIGGSLKHVRRPSMETTPPPLMQTQMDMILPPNIKYIEDTTISSESSSGNQLQTLIRNGFNRSVHHPRMKGLQYMPPSMHQQQQQQQNFQPSGFQTLNYNMQNLSIDNNCGPQTHMVIDGSSGVGVNNMLPVMNSNRSAGSDSGSSLGSSGDLSPPETPTLLHQQQQHPHKQHPFVKGINLSRINGGRTDKGGGNHTPMNVNPNNSNNNNNNNSNNNNTATPILYAGNTTGAPQLYTPSGTGDIILAPTVSSPVATVASSVSSNPSSASNNNAVSAVAAAASGTVLMPSYNASYPYHALANNSALRPPLMAQPNLGAPPPPNNFRLPGGFQLPPPPPPPNGELIYPYHPAGAIAFLSSAHPPPPVTMRTNNTTNPAPTGQSIVSPFALSSGSVNKSLSCYNCGSQTHSGRDCQSPSMDDATRGAVYKLDYSVAAQQNATTITGTQPINSPTGSQIDVKPQQQQINVLDTHTSTTVVPNCGTNAGASNVKSMQ